MPSLVCRCVCVLHEFVFLLFFPSFHTLSPMMMIVGLILYLLRARGGSPPRVLRGGGGRRAPICLGSRASLAPPPRLKIKISLDERKKGHRRTPLESNRRARASPGFLRPNAGPDRAEGVAKALVRAPLLRRIQGRGRLRRRPLLGHDHRARAVRGRRGAERVRPAVPRAAGVAQHGLGRGPASPLRRVCAVGSGERGRTRRDIVSERSGDGREARRCADRRRRGSAREVASAPARAFPRVSGAGNATDARGAADEKSERRASRNVPAAPQWSHGPPGLTYAAWCCGCGARSGCTSSISASSFALAPLSVSSASSSLVSSGSLRIRSSSSRNSASDAPGPYSSRRTSVYHCLVEGGYPTCGSYSRIAGFAATRSEGGTTSTFSGCAARPTIL